MKKLYTVENYSRRDEWLRNRGAFGGSTASALFGANPYMTALDVYCAAVNPNINENEDSNPTISQKYGQDAESIIRELVKLNFDKKYNTISPEGYTLYRRKDKPYMTATLDGVMVERDTRKKDILEIKTHIVVGKNDLENWQDRLPQNYFIQGIHYLAVLNDFRGVRYACKLQWLDYETGLPEKEEIKYYYVARKKHRKDVSYLEQIETDFYENHILKRIPPNIKIDL